MSTNMSQQHIQGCASVCFSDLSSLRDIMNQMMKDYYKNLMDCAKTEADLSMQEALAGFKTAQNQKRASQMQGIGEMVSGGVGIAAAGADVIGQFKTFSSIADQELIQKNILSTQEELKRVKPIALESGNMPKEEITVQERQNIANQLKNNEYKDSISDNLKGDIAKLSKEEIDEIDAHLNNKLQSIKTETAKLNRTLKLLNGLLQITNSVSSTIKSFFTLQSSTYQFLEAVFNVLSKTDGENRQTETNGDDALTSDGIKNAIQAADAINQAIQAIMTADTVRA